MEKLSPVLALYWVKDFAAGMDICESLLRFGGLGHTCGIYSKDDARIREYALRMPANRVLVNTPTPQGSTGITTNVFPSMTLGCGAAAGNITSDNVGPQHLYNIKRLAYAVRTPAEAFETPARLPVASLPAAGLAAAESSIAFSPARYRAADTATRSCPASRDSRAGPFLRLQRSAAAPASRARRALQTGNRRLRLRGRRPPRHQTIPQNLHRPQNHRHPLRPRFGRAL